MSLRSRSYSIVEGLPGEYAASPVQPIGWSDFESRFRELASRIDSDGGIVGAKGNYGDRGYVSDTVRQYARDFLEFAKQHYAIGVIPRGQSGVAKEFNKLVSYIEGICGEKNGFYVGHGKSLLNRLGVMHQEKIDVFNKYFVLGSGKARMAEYRGRNALYLNRVSMPDKKLIEYANHFDDLFDGLKGWRRKALAGLQVVFSDAKLFRGTNIGEYHMNDKKLYIKFTPAIFKKMLHGQNAIDYIAMHELGHRYEDVIGLPVVFSKPEWYTTPYSMMSGMLSAGEAFPELFALSHFKVVGNWDPEIYDKFEKVMK